MTPTTAARRPISDPVRILVVDDSAVVRGLIARQLEAEPDLSVSATAADGRLALRVLEQQPIDVVVLDIEMPVMDGITALSEIVRLYPAVRVVMASTLTRRNAEISLKALQLGAADYIAKPESGLGGAEAFKRELTEKVRALGQSRCLGTPAPGSPARPVGPRPAGVLAPVPRVAAGVSAIAIGASTGGPQALLRLFAALRDSVRQPIFLTQHMPATFTGLLAEQLQRAGARPCAEAVDGERIEAGRCYVAPGGWHMRIVAESDGPRIRLNQDAPEHFCRPAVDPMLRSLSETYGAGLLAVVLTGMGADGAAGCREVVRRGGRFITQDEATSVVWGMPGAAAATGLAQAILPLDAVGPWMRRASL